MMREILLLELLISSMADNMRLKAWFVRTNFLPDSATMAAVSSRFPEFLRTMEVISSVEAEVSSREAACSDAP